ncbi:hypothetical protein [Roseateles sp.]|uniref:hypothetical protein n=1 Tax=Roseateles sp. TaxID=1971397 RepID=UPI003264B53C
MLPRLPAVLLLLLSGLSALSPAHAAEPTRTPRQLIDSLGVEIRQILENRRSSRTTEDAERAVAEQITALARSSPGDDSLIEADAQGRTPLMLAVSGAYPLVVRALLADPIVKVRINAADKAGETAWMVANFAPSLTLVACQPGALTLERYPLLPPYLRRMTDLLRAKDSTAMTIVKSLEQAGARVDQEGARQAWLSRCPNTTPELRQALNNGALLTTLVDHAMRRQTSFSKTYREGLAGIPQKPPQDMKFVRVSAGLRQNVNRLQCAHREAPSLRGALPWSGELLFKVEVATRSGAVEAVDFNLLSSGGSNPQVVDYFRSVILQALAALRCEGEHVFEQEFKFKIE